LVDERLTTKAATRALHEAGVRERRGRKVVDKMAATLLLQTYLDARSR
jgi:putative Holliday junction resolvase